MSMLFLLPLHVGINNLEIDATQPASPFAGRPASLGTLAAVAHKCPNCTVVVYCGHETEIWNVANSEIL